MKTKLSVIVTFSLLMTLVLAIPAFADGSVTYTGQGFTFDGTTYSLNDQRCGLTGQNDANDGGTGQFATWNDGPGVNTNGDWGDGSGGPYRTGQPYLVWVLTANGATSATIKLPDGNTYNMYNVGGTFKYASGYFNRDTLVNYPVVAHYTGTAKGKVQLTVSHGCPPGEGGWCSPGFWRNASDGAWQAAGFADKATGMAALFNNTVVPNYYATANSNANLTIGTVLTDVGGPGGANKYGGPDAPFGLNAFNATGAFLTDQLIGGFDPSKVGDEGACQIDHHGNYKEGAGSTTKSLDPASANAIFLPFVRR